MRWALLAVPLGIEVLWCIVLTIVDARMRRVKNPDATMADGPAWVGRLFQAFLLYHVTAVFIEDLLVSESSGVGPRTMLIALLLYTGLVAVWLALRGV